MIPWVDKMVLLILPRLTQWLWSAGSLAGWPTMASLSCLEHQLRRPAFSFQPDFVMWWQKCSKKVRPEGSWDIAQNLAIITSVAFCWLKWATRPAQIQKMGKETPLFDRRDCREFVAIFNPLKQLSSHVFLVHRQYVSLGCVPRSSRAGTTIQLQFFN